MATTPIPLVERVVRQPAKCKRNKTWVRWIAPDKMPKVRSLTDGLLQISHDDKLVTERSLRGDLFRTLDLVIVRMCREWNVPINELRVRWWVLPTERVTRQLQIVRKHEREKQIPVGEWSQYLQLFQPTVDGSWEYPATSLFPRVLYGVYEVYFRWRDELVPIYTGLSSDCVRKRLFRHFQEPDPCDQYGWFCPSGSPHIVVRFMRLRLEDLDEAEHILIQKEQPPMNRDRKNRPYQRRLFSRYRRRDEDREEIPF